MPTSCCTIMSIMVVWMDTSAGVHAVSGLKLCCISDGGSSWQMSVVATMLVLTAAGVLRHLTCTINHSHSLHLYVISPQEIITCLRSLSQRRCNCQW